MNRKQVLIAALRAAGAAVLKYDPSVVDTEIKSGAGDLVTAADLASEKVIVETIKVSFASKLSERCVQYIGSLTPPRTF